MTSVRPVRVRFYVDADLLGLGHALAALRNDVTYPGDPGKVIHKRARPACPVLPRTLDEDWLPTVAAEGWLIITRDRSIQDVPAEIAAVKQNRAKMVNLTAESAGTTWGQLEVVMRHWRAIDELQRRDGPFIVRASLSRMTSIAL